MVKNYVKKCDFSMADVTLNALGKKMPHANFVD
jgi:hypothetical protein